MIFGWGCGFRAPGPLKFWNRGGGKILGLYSNYLIHNIKYFNPGAGGSQKLRRGFSAIPIYSLHLWYDKTMASIIKSWLPIANQKSIEEINTSNNEVPFNQLKREC